MAACVWPPHACMQPDGLGLAWGTHLVALPSAARRWPSPHALPGQSGGARRVGPAVATADACGLGSMQSWHAWLHGACMRMGQSDTCTQRQASMQQAAGRRLARFWLYTPAYLRRCNAANRTHGGGLLRPAGWAGAGGWGEAEGGMWGGGGAVGHLHMGAAGPSVLPAAPPTAPHLATAAPGGAARQRVAIILCVLAKTTARPPPPKAQDRYGGEQPLEAWGESAWPGGAAHTHTRARLHEGLQFRGGWLLAFLRWARLGERARGKWAARAGRSRED